MLKTKVIPLEFMVIEKKEEKEEKKHTKKTLKFQRIIGGKNEII